MPGTPSIAAASAALHAQALLELAWRRLHASPVLATPEGAPPLVAAAGGFAVDEALALFAGLGRPRRPAFCCRIRLPPWSPAPVAPPVG